MRNNYFYLFTLIVIGTVGVLAGWFLHSSTPRQEVLPVLGRVPDYTLTNQLGHQVSSKTFHGKVRVVAFLFPYCRGYCPLIAHNFVSFARVLKASQNADDVQLIAFNVDPENTGTAQMKKFQQQYGWDPNDTHWQYLTGSLKEIRQIVTNSYHIYFEKVSDADGAEGSNAGNKVQDSLPEPVVSNKLADESHVDYDIVHNDMLAIVDTDGRIRKLFDDAERVSDEQIMKVVFQLLPLR